MSIKQITVLGGGSWGTALAQLLAQNGHAVKIWTRNLNRFEKVSHNLVNKTYHPEIPLHKSIKASTDLNLSCREAEVIVYALPSYVAQSYFNRFKNVIRNECVLISTSKGIDNYTLSTVSQNATQVWGHDFTQNYFACLSGPSFAYDVMRNKPTAVTVASKNEGTAQLVQNLFHQNTFQVFRSRDLIGVELGGALKNVFAITCGFADGFSFGSSTRAALITRSLSEIIGIGQKMGADPLTFSGLSGLGDLILTCTTDLSRNRRVGLMLAEGKSLRHVIRSIGQLAEGIRTARSAYRLSQKIGFNSLIIEQVYHSLYENKDAETAITQILNAPPTQELSS